MARGKVKLNRIIVCVRSYSVFFTVGKKYKVIDGQIYYNFGCCSNEIFYSLKQINEFFCSQFEYYKKPFEEVK